MKIQWFLLAIVGASLVAGCGKGGGGQLASVNGEPITMDDFMDYIKTKDRVRVLTQTGVAEARVADTLAYQTLEDLVLRKTVIQLASDEGVCPDEAKIKQEIEFRKQLNPNFIQTMTTAGLTLERIKENLKIDLCYEGLLTKGINVTDADVDRFIKDNKLDITPASADMSWVFVKTTAKRDQVDAELRSGQSFTTVARRLSEAKNVETDGARYGIRVIAQMPQKLQDVVKATSEGQTTAWIEGDGGFAKFYVEKRVDDKKEAMSVAKKTFWKREYMKQEGQKAKDLGKKLADFMITAKVVVEPKDLKASWEKAIERAKKERKVDVPMATGNAGGN